MTRARIVAGSLLLLASGLGLVIVPMAAARPPQACTLLTNAEVAKVFGEKVELRTVTGVGGCKWSGLPLGTFTSAHPQLILFVGQVTKARFEKLGQRQPGEAPGPLPLPVHGVGQLAFASDNDDSLEVWSHGTELSFLNSGIVAPIASMKILAAAAIARL
jgi:hypothetical protein